MNTVAAIDNNMAFAIGNTGLFAINLTTHAEQWGIADTGFSRSPAVLGNTVYAIHGTQVRAYDVATGTAARGPSTPVKHSWGNPSSPTTP